MSTIKAKSVPVELSDGRTIEVRRMKWKPAKEFLKKLSAIASKVMRRGEGQAAELIANIPAVVAESEELVSLLASASASLTPAEFDDLDSLDALKILGAAFEINYDAELKNFLAGIMPKFAVPTSDKPVPATN